MKKFLLIAVAALFIGGFGDVKAQNVKNFTILQALTPTHHLRYAGTSVAITSNFTSQTRVIRAVCTTACFVQTEISGTTPVAFATGSTTSTFLPANVPEYFIAPRNGKIAVIQLSATGVLYVQEYD